MQFFSQNDRSISVINTLDIESLVVIVGMDFKASIINGEKVLKVSLNPVERVTVVGSDFGCIQFTHAG